jgi:hypothetical protein
MPDPKIVRMTFTFVPRRGQNISQGRLAGNPRDHSGRVPTGFESADFWGFFWAGTNDLTYLFPDANNLFRQ